MPVSRLPLVGLLAIPFVVAFVVALEPVAFLAIINTALIVIAVRLMFGSDDLDTLEGKWSRIR
jgi:galactitol-specific phosphotransferase system IIC component